MYVSATNWVDLHIKTLIDTVSLPNVRHSHMRTLSTTFSCAIVHTRWFFFGNVCRQVSIFLSGRKLSWNSQTETKEKNVTFNSDTLIWKIYLEICNISKYQLWNSITTQAIRFYFFKVIHLKRIFTHLIIKLSGWKFDTQFLHKAMSDFFSIESCNLWGWLMVKF